jgi:hypothetical protein
MLQLPMEFTSTNRGDYIPNNTNINPKIEMSCLFREFYRGNMMYFGPLGENGNHFPVAQNFPRMRASFIRHIENNYRSQQGGGDHIPNHILHSSATIRSSSGANDYDGRLQHEGGDHIPNRILHSGTTMSSLDYNNGSDEDISSIDAHEEPDAEAVVQTKTLEFSACVD